MFRDLLRAARWHRRLLAGIAAAAAVYFGLVALSPAPPPTVAVLAAARDLAGGAVPAGGDLRTIGLPPGSVPDGALRPGADLTARVLSGPVRSGEPLTDARFLAPAAVPAGSLAYPFRIDDADISALLRVGAAWPRAAAAPPSSVIMNSRRPIIRSPRRHGPIESAALRGRAHEPWAYL